MNYQKCRCGSLDVLKIPAKSNESPYVILFHGYGADATDLMPFSQILDPSHRATWLFPNGHKEVHFSPFYSGRSWFHVDIEALMNAKNLGKSSELMQKSLPGMAEARDLVNEMLKDCNISMSDVILGGFSQGAMLATELALTSPVAPKGLLILSGTLLDEQRWAELASKKPGLPFFQSHGDNDPLLDLIGAQKLERLFLNAGMVGQLYIFNGSHEIPQLLIPHMKNFLFKPNLLP